MGRSCSCATDLFFSVVFVCYVEQYGYLMAPFIFCGPLFNDTQKFVDV